MESSKIFACQICDEDIEIADANNTDTTVCHNCGQEYLVRFVERAEAWELIPVETTEEERHPADQEEAEPFQVLSEPAALREDDTDRY